MGSYVYRRTSEVFHAELDGQEVVVNCYRYFTKPYWNLWDYVFDLKMPTYLEGYDRRYVAKMRRAIARQDINFARMERDGKVSNIVVICSDKDKPDGREVYREKRSYSRMVDDPWHGKAELLGTMVKVGRKWVIRPTAVLTQKENEHGTTFATTETTGWEAIDDC